MIVKSFFLCFYILSLVIATHCSDTGFEFLHSELGEFFDAKKFKIVMEKGIPSLEFTALFKSFTPATFCFRCDRIMFSCVHNGSNWFLEAPWFIHCLKNNIEMPDLTPFVPTLEYDSNIFVPGKGLIDEALVNIQYSKISYMRKKLEDQTFINFVCFHA